MKSLKLICLCLMAVCMFQNCSNESGNSGIVFNAVGPVNTYNDDEVVEMIFKYNPELQEKDIKVKKDVNNRIVSLRVRGGKKLSILPREIGYLSELKILRLANLNGLSKIPDEIGRLTKLEELYLHRNEIVSVPYSIGRCYNLRVLTLRHNPLTGLPYSIIYLENLEKLTLGTNIYMKELPRYMGYYRKLRILDAEECGLTYLPYGIGNLARIESLNLFANELTYLPDEITKLTPTNCDLSFNYLCTEKNSNGTWKYRWQKWASKYDPDWHETQRP